jgi:hypothetical protein
MGGTKKSKRWQGPESNRTADDILSAIANYPNRIVEERKLRMRRRFLTLAIPAILAILARMG